MTTNGYSGKDFENTTTSSCFQQQNMIHADDNSNNLFIAPRPLERQLTNILMIPSNQLVQNGFPSAPSCQKKEKVMNIILNPPFIKLNRDDVRLRCNDDREKNANNCVNRVNPAIQRSTPGVRQVPSRLCKGRQTTTTNSFFRKTTKNEDKDYRRSSMRRRKRPLSSTPHLSYRHRASRASTRLYQKFRQEKAIKPRSRCLRVSRTVELVNQTNDTWRDEKSKLLYMLSLGLTPISSKTQTVLSPKIKLTPVDPHIVAQIQLRYEEERLLRLEKEKWNGERLRRLRILNSRNNEASKSIEIIDLASDEDDEEKICVNSLAAFYPNVQLTELKSNLPMFGVDHGATTNSGINAGPSFQSRSVPPNIKTRLKSLLQLHCTKQNKPSAQSFVRKRYNPSNPLTPLRLPIANEMVRFKEKSNIKIANSPPMKLKPQELAEFTQRFRRIISNPNGVVSCVVKPIQKPILNTKSTQLTDEDDVILLD